MDDDVRGITPPLVFLTLITSIWTIGFVFVAVLTSTALLPLEFSLSFVDGNIAALVTGPVFAFCMMAFIVFLSVITIHAFTIAVGGSGGLDKTVQAVAYSFTPFALVFVPLVATALNFITLVVIVLLAPIVVSVLGLLVIAVSTLHDLNRSKSLGVVAGSALALALITAYVAAGVM